MKFYVIFGIMATLAVQAALADDSKDSATAATSAATTVAASKTTVPSGDAGKHSTSFSFGGYLGTIENTQSKGS